MILKLKDDLKVNKTATIEYNKECFCDLLDNIDFLLWLYVKLGYKPNRMKKLLSEEAPNKRKLSNLTIYQDIYNFWLSKTINPNNSKANVVSIMISLLLQQYKFITDQNLKHKEQLCQVTQLSL